MIPWAIKKSLMAVPKGSVDVKTLEKDLSVKELGFTNKGRKSLGIKPLWREDSERFYLPRNYLRNKGIKIKEFRDLTKEGTECPKMVFKAKLRDYQEEFFRQHDRLFTDTDVVIEAGCGSGKTVMSIYMVCKRAVKTIVLVPTNFLADQYYDRCVEFVDGAKVSRATTKKIDWEDADILILSYELFKVRKFTKEFFEEFGHFVIDEGHRVGADGHEKITAMMPAKYRTMLTATFRREDGTMEIIEHHFSFRAKMKKVNPDVLVFPLNIGKKYGTIVSFKKNFEKEKSKSELLEALKVMEDVGVSMLRKGHNVEFLEPMEVQKCFFKINHNVLSKKTSNIIDSIIYKVGLATKNPQYAAVDSYVSMDKVRNVKLAKFCRDLVVRDGRRVLILGKRLDQLNYFDSYLKNCGIVSQVLNRETNAALRKAKKLEKTIGEAQVIVGIDKLAKEGMDVDKLDTLVLLTPIGDTEQAFGRVSRILKGKKKPYAFYPYDQCTPYQQIFKKSQKFIPINGRIQKEIYLDDYV